MPLRNLTLTLLAASALSACTLAPKTVRPELPVANAWPIAQYNTGGANTGSAVTAADLGWREVFIDPRLQGVIDLALANNRDLRVAVLNIEQSRAQYRIQRAALVPAVAASASGSQSRLTADQAAVQAGGDRTV